ncbi:MAG: hypothetical protein R3F34_02645 [Planctomycetota bacterium]
MIKRLAKSRFVRDSAILQASGMLVAGGGVLSTLTLAHVIGDELQGVYILAISVYSLAFMLLNTGVQQAAVSQLGLAFARGQVDKVASWLAFVVKIYALAGLVLLLVLGPAMPWACRVLLDDAGVGRLAWMLTLVPLLDIPRVVTVIVFQAGRRMADVARIEIGAEAARLVCVVAGAFATRDPLGPSIGMIVATALASVFSMQIFRRAGASADGPKLPGVRYVLSHVRDVPDPEGTRPGRPDRLHPEHRRARLRDPPAALHQGRGARRGLPGRRRQGLGRALPHRAACHADARDVHAGDQPDGDAGAREVRGNGRRRGLQARLAAHLGHDRRPRGGGGLVTAALAPWIVLVTPDSYHVNVVDMCRIMAIGYSALGFVVAMDTFYILANRLRVALVMVILQALAAYPVMYALDYYVPRTGGAWGVVVIMSYSVFHLSYIGWYFKSGKHLVEFEGRAVSARTSDEGEDDPANTTDEGAAAVRP